MEYVIEPRRGVGPVRFGMSRDEVRDEMERLGEGRPEQRGKETDCYFGLIRRYELFQSDRKN